MPFTDVRSSNRGVRMSITEYEAIDRKINIGFSHTSTIYTPSLDPIL
jgi:hypothetical protein